MPTTRPPTETAWFWAKLGTATWPARYHPTICHLIDVGCVVAALWEHGLRPPLRRRIALRLGCGAGPAGKWVAFWVAAHDIGKVTPDFQFQGKTDALRTRLAERGYEPRTGENRHHTDTGTRILRDALAAGTGGVARLDPALAVKVAVSVGGHHGLFPSHWDRADVGSGPWEAARADLLARLAHLFGVVGLPAPAPPAGADQSVWMVLAGLTAVADWIGSNTAFFPPRGDASLAARGELDLDAYFADAKAQAAEAMTELGWLDRAAPTGVTVPFQFATDVLEPRPLQTAVIPLARAMADAGTPRLLVVEAPMGEGKTEAAWYAADCWDRGGGAGTYVALPTMATSNQMFERVAKFLRIREGKQNLVLLHGKAPLNTRFVALKFAAEAYDRDGGGSAVVAEGWFASNKKHGLLAPVGVGTIDQALLAVLQTKHGFVRLFGLAGKCVVLDEVHAYDAYMTTLMKRLLEWLAALGCPVVLLSATLPAGKRAELVRAYAGKATPDPDKASYPRVTSVVVGGKPAVEAFAADPARRKEIPLEWVEETDLAGNLEETLAGGGCAAVIRNTVGLAQETYLRLKAAFDGSDVEVELFHARFPFGRRDDIEKSVLSRFGKAGGPVERNRRILVATQVVEQSLDLDFDAMYTDVAPADLVLQRAGRLHRHGRAERPIAEPRLHLIAPGTKADGRLDFVKSEYVYARFVLLRSYFALKPRTVVTLPDDLERLVEQVYGAEPLAVPADAVDDLAASETALREEKRAQGMKAKGAMIWTPDTEDLLNQPSRQLREDDPEAHSTIRAATRDTEPTIQLVLVYRRGGGDFLDPDGSEPFDETALPTVTQTRRLTRNEVTIAHRGCVAWYAARPVPTGWKKCGLLQHHRLVRLGPDGRALAGQEYEMAYDPEVGVRFGG